MSGEPKSKWTLIQKRPEIQQKQVFPTESKVKLKLRTNRNYPVYERGCPHLNVPLFTLHFFIVLKSRTVTKSITLA